MCASLAMAITDASSCGIGGCQGGCAAGVGLMGIGAVPPHAGSSGNAYAHRPIVLPVLSLLKCTSHLSWWPTEHSCKPPPKKKKLSGYRHPPPKKIAGHAPTPGTDTAPYRCPMQTLAHVQSVCLLGGPFLSLMGLLWALVGYKPRQCGGTNPRNRPPPIILPCWAPSRMPMPHAHGQCRHQPMCSRLAFFVLQSASVPFFPSCVMSSIGGAGVVNLPSFHTNNTSHHVGTCP